jgi:hypothetical protein
MLDNHREWRIDVLSWTRDNGETTAMHRNGCQNFAKADDSKAFILLHRDCRNRERLQ